MSADKPAPPVPAANDENSELTALKNLLLGQEQSAIRQLEHERSDRGIQTERVAQSLPDSLSKAYRESPEALTASLGQPVAVCLRESVQREPGVFADVLYPVMGPAIRRSISQALKGLVQQINQSLEHSFTFKGLKWRMEAARTGVPFAEVVLRHNLRFRVEEVFLIQSGSGLLIQHLGLKKSDEGDADATSAMLTAIRDFARDTFDRQSGNESRLETIDAGDHTLWLIHGPKAYLACAIRGVAPVSLRDELNRILEGVHRRYGDLLTSFDGDPAEAAPLLPLLERCLRAEVAESDGKRRPWPFILVLLALIAGLSWWGYGVWQHNEQTKARIAKETAALAQLGEDPGTVVTDWRRQDERLLISGLHDPLTPAPETRLKAAGLDENDFRLSFRNFQSAAPEVAIKRARQRLAPPDSLKLELTPEGTLIASGTADQTWRARARLLAITVPGVESYDDSASESLDQRLLREITERIQPPDRVEIQVHDAIATFSGKAPLAWVESLPNALVDQPGLAGIVDRDLKALETDRLQQLQEMIEQVRIYFVGGIELDASQLPRIESLAALLGEAYSHAQALGKDMVLQIIGRTDGTGTPEQNLQIARQRAETLSQQLAATSYEMPPFSLGARTLPDRQLEPDAELRRVDFRLLGLNDQDARNPR